MSDDPAPDPADGGGTAGGHNELSGHAGGPVVQAGTIVGGVRVHAAGRATVVGAIVGVVVVLAGMLLWQQEQPSTPQAPPASLTVSWRMGGKCYYQYVRDGGVQGHSPGVVLSMTAQNESEQEVVITGVRVEVHDRLPAPTSGEFVTVGCLPSRVEARGLEVDLDAPDPEVVHLPAELAPRVEGAPAPPAPDFPYQVRKGEPEHFAVNFRAKTCDCRFSLVVDWVVGGETRQTAVPANDTLRIVPVVEALVVDRR
ncbi:hypothetical protein AB0H12_41130 [Actinosynnema sp. NPDC023794]